MNLKEMIYILSKGDWFMTGSVIQPFKVNKKGDKQVDFELIRKNKF